MIKKRILMAFITISLILVVFLFFPMTVGDLPHTGGFHWIEKGENGVSFIFSPN